MSVYCDCDCEWLAVSLYCDCDCELSAMSVLRDRASCVTGQLCQYSLTGFVLGQVSYVSIS